MEKSNTQPQDYKVVVACTSESLNYRGKRFPLESRSETTYYFATEDDALDFLIGHLSELDFFGSWFNDRHDFGFWSSDEENSLSCYLEKWPGFDENLEVKITDAKGNLVGTDISEVLHKTKGHFDDDWYKCFYIHPDEGEVLDLHLAYKGKSLFLREPVPEEATTGLYGRWNEEVGGAKKREPINPADYFAAADADLPF